MGYQVLARKWRPGSFNEMVGQEHVLKALVNALENDRLHHAYLFTGTRGVGKTTVARIFAKCLNCEQGVTAQPCGTCGSCNEVAEGRFVDLIEVDAASKTKIDDTRELLDNVQYAPTRGRYKVYLIDEVHMLSGHSFNALLKTLEEPPPHVKFLLATTDPQKLPITILSRCLQFNLKNLTAERIVKHLNHVLEQEQVPTEESALWALARGADGSMRDALSLTDQAIAHGNGKVTEAEVAAMLGTINLSTVKDIALALCEGDVEEALRQVAAMAEFSPDYLGALSDLLSLWHRVAMYQAMPEAVDNSHGDLSTVTDLATRLSREDVQLFYQIGLLARKDLPLAPEPRIGFEMAMLRMHAFRPQLSAAEPVATTQTSAPAMEVPQGTVKKPEAAPAAQPQPEISNHSAVEANLLAAGSEVEPQPKQKSEPAPQSADPSQIPPWESVPPEYQQQESAATDIATEPALSSEQLHNLAQQVHHKNLPEPEPEPEKKFQPEVQEQPGSGPQSIDQGPRLTLSELETQQYQQQWITIYEHLNVAGLLQNTAANLVLVEVRDKLLRFELDKDYSSLYNDSHQTRLSEVLSDYFCEEVQADIEIGEVIDRETPQAFRERRIQEKRDAAIVLLKNDPNIQMLEQVFDAELVESSVRPLD